MDETQVRTEVLVIGSGIAGASAALAAADAGRRVIVVTKGPAAEASNTYQAQGGIVTLGPDDDPAILREDIVKAGDGLNNPEAVEILVREGRRLVDEILIERLGVPFTRGADGGFNYAREAGHSRRRILHVKDTTGMTIEEAFVAALKSHPGIRVEENATAVDLLTIPHHARNPISYYREPRCLGAYVLDNATCRVKTLIASRTVLAAGGCGAVFLNTSNPRGTIGAGYAMAHRAGARIVNMEYIQFHPTVLYHRDAGGFLISETVRGEGARLKTTDGRTFMDKHGGLKDLAPRDEVARAIYDEMLLTNATHVLLDLASYAKVNIPERFPCIYATCLKYGIDITREPIPVVPAAHYCCGGVLVDGRGRTSLQGLYAAGEVACTGLHGANRLASTSLLEGLVWGTLAGRDAAGAAPGPIPAETGDVHEWRYPDRGEPVDPALLNQDWLTIRSTLWNYAGIVRTRKRLERAKADLEYLRHRIERFYQEADIGPGIIGLRQGIQVALMITHAALANPVSAGAHFRLD
jgi:L-aspartate oxidase